jgi:hypothetical protein
VRDRAPRFPDADGGAASATTATQPEWIRRLAPPAFWAGLSILALVAVLTVPGNPLLDLNKRRYRVAGTVTAHAGALLVLFGLLRHAPRWLSAVVAWSPARLAVSLSAATVAPLAALGMVAAVWPAYARALMREWGLTEAGEVALYLIAAWLAARHAAMLEARAADHRPYRLLSALCVALAVEEMDWFGIPGAVLGRIGEAKVYLGSSHDLLKVAWHYPRVAPLLAVSGLAMLWLVWRRGYLTLAFLRREALDLTTLPLYGALAAQVLAQALDVDDALLTSRYWIFRLRLEEPLELVAGLLLASGLLLKYRRDWLAAGRPPVGQASAAGEGGVGPAPSRG